MQSYCLIQNHNHGFEPVFHLILMVFKRSLVLVALLNALVEQRFKLINPYLFAHSNPQLLKALVQFVKLGLKRIEPKKVNSKGLHLAFQILFDLCKTAENLEYFVGVGLDRPEYVFGLHLVLTPLQLLVLLQTDFGGLLAQRQVKLIQTLVLPGDLRGLQLGLREQVRIHLSQLGGHLLV